MMKKFIFQIKNSHSFQRPFTFFFSNIEAKTYSFHFLIISEGVKTNSSDKLILKSSWFLLSNSKTTYNGKSTYK